MFRICLIGCGFMTRTGHGPACRQYAQTHSDTVLSACCDINLAAAQEACEHFGFQRAYTDYVKMVNTQVCAQMVNGTLATLHFLPCGGCVAERVAVTLPDHTFYLELPVWGGMDMPGKLVCTKGRDIYKTLIGDKETMFESNGFYNESSVFFDSIRTGKPPYSDVITGGSSVAIADHIRQRKAFYNKRKEM